MRNDQELRNITPPARHSRFVGEPLQDRGLFEVRGGDLSHLDLRSGGLRRIETVCGEGRHLGLLETLQHRHPFGFRTVAERVERRAAGHLLPGTVQAPPDRLAANARLFLPPE